MAFVTNVTEDLYHKLIELSEQQLLTWLDDLEQAAVSLMDEFAANPGWVRAWEVALSGKLDNAIRTNPVDLSKIYDYLTSSEKNADDLAAEILGSSKTTASSTRSWIDVVPNGGGSKIGQLGDYDIHENAEIFYRGISEADYQTLLSTGKLPATSETFTSSSLQYIIKKGYGSNGKIVKFYTESGTLDALKNDGVRDNANRTLGYFPDMPPVSGGWTSSKAYFKTEGDDLFQQGLIPNPVVNIGLGSGTGLTTFNNGVKAIEVVK